MLYARILALLFIMAAVIAGSLWVISRSMFLMSMIEISAPGVLPARMHADCLDSENADLVMTCLSILEERGDPIAVERGVELLESTDDYIWLNAAHYVGACGRVEAVPYLIKAFRHTASFSDEERAGYLREITGQDFGTDFEQWRAWWRAQHPDSTMDWRAHLGFRPRLPELEEEEVEPAGAENAGTSRSPLRHAQR